MGVCVRSQKDRARSVCSTQLIPGPNLPILPDHSPQERLKRASILLPTNYLRTTKKQYPNKVYNAV